jgi:hypothetical protein
MWGMGTNLMVDARDAMGQDRCRREFFQAFSRGYDRGICRPKVLAPQVLSHVLGLEDPRVQAAPLRCGSLCLPRTFVLHDCTG